MANPDIQLSAATRANLLSLSRTTDLIGRTQERLATGLRVNSAVDDAISFFQARSLSDRASDLTLLKGDIDQSINAVETAAAGIESIVGIVEQMKGLAISAQSQTTASARSTAAVQFNDLRDQIDNLSNEAVMFQSSRRFIMEPFCLHP